MGFIMSMFSGVGLKVMAGLAIVGAILAILAGAKSAGRQAERVDAMKRTLKSVEDRNEVEREVMRLGGDVARERLLDKWSRD
jgi:mannose/fructose/N-acetylgalactosamine-specific phosphotransferase system component IIC